MSRQVEEREAERITDAVCVRRWRRKQFRDMGFSLREAQQLTKSPVDLGEMRRLLAAGCPPDTAQKILL